MDDRFDESLKRRMRALEDAVPSVSMEGRGALNRSQGNRVRTVTRLPVGSMLGILAAVVVVAVVAGNLRNGPNAAAPLSESPSQSQSAVSTGEGMPAVGMVVADAQARPIPGSGNPVIVTATINNRTGSPDKLLSASSPIASTGGLYATSGEWPIPTDGTGMANLRLMPWWAIGIGETIQLRAGDGEVVLNGLASPLSVGQTVVVTFEFASAPPVTITIPVVSDTAAN